MPNARIVTAYGAIDGVNVKFYTGVPYVPGSTVYILNGRTHRPDYDDGHIESNAGTGEITVKEPPLDGDVVQIFFTDTAPTQSSPVEKLNGSLQSQPTRLTGNLRPAKPVVIQGNISASSTPGRLQGTLRPSAPTRVTGVIKGGRLVGRLKEKC